MNSTPADLGDSHPNTALIELQGVSGKTLSLLGSLHRRRKGADSQH